LPVIGGRPDFVLVVVLAWAMLRGSNEGAIVGFLGGILLDSV
jgi:rod shape-determining protein MreD